MWKLDLKKNGHEHKWGMTWGETSGRWERKKRGQGRENIIEVYFKHV
jgi:hypothetical protein